MFKIIYPSADATLYESLSTYNTGLDEILEVDNIDVFFVGPGDLSQELGYIGEPDHPEVRKVVQNTIDRITKAGKVAGTVASITSYEWAMQTGARFFLSGAIDWIYQGFN